MEINKNDEFNENDNIDINEGKGTFLTELNHSMDEEKNNKENNIPYHEPKSMEYVRKEYTKLQDVVNNFNQKISKIMDSQKTQFLESYQKHMYKVQKELYELRKVANSSDKSLQVVHKINELEEKSSKYRDEAISLDKEANKLKKELQLLRGKLEMLEADKEWLVNQLDLTKRQTKFLKSRFLTLENNNNNIDNNNNNIDNNDNDDDDELLNQETIFKKKIHSNALSTNITELNNINRNSFLVNSRPHTTNTYFPSPIKNKSKHNSLKMTNSLFSNNTNSIGFNTYNINNNNNNNNSLWDDSNTIEHLNRSILKEKKEIKKLRSNIIKQKRYKTKVRNFFLDCIDVMEKKGHGELTHDLEILYDELFEN